MPKLIAVTKPDGTVEMVPDPAGDSAPNPPEGTPPAPELVEIKIGGKPVKVEKDVADAYRREINERDGRHGAQLDGLRKEVAELRTLMQPPKKDEPADKTPQGPQLPDPDLAYTDPAAYKKQLGEYLDYRDTQLAETLTKRHEEQEKRQKEEQGRQDAWGKQVTKFYSDNPDLVDAEEIVDGVWKRNYNQLKDLPVEEGFKEVAKLARERILVIAGKGRGDTTRPPKVEGSRSRGADAEPVGESKPEGGGLSAMIRARQNRKRAASRRPAPKE